MFADAVLVVSNHLLEKITRAAKGRFKVALDPITVDFRNFDSLQRHDHDSLRVFYGGTFDEKDGVAYLIEAFEEDAKSRAVHAGHATYCPAEEAYRIIEFFGEEYDASESNYGYKLTSEDGSFYSFSMMFGWAQPIIS